ncbi:MAG: peptidoglycan-binding domain-containing protein [Candidatus Omnitrophota bacterium]|nr:peptidoglycan-binding domain-containing protein [Candidatus Omnitrophota bacterium]
MKFLESALDASIGSSSILIEAEGLNRRRRMDRKNLAFAVVAVTTVCLMSGCSTVPKKFKEEVSGIKSKVDTLESRVESVESKQTESESMVSQQSRAIEEMRSEKAGAVNTNVTFGAKPPKSKERIKEIQICLGNAGFYKGDIDGVKGRGTKKAIKEFQKANGLKADGKIGAKTWEVLSKYVNAPAQAAAGAEEGAIK